MVKMYFLGGESIVKRDAKEINEAAFADAGGTPSILVFTWARPSFDIRYRRRKSVSEYFRSLGARSVDFCDYSESKKEILARMDTSDLVYLTGGQVTALITRARASGLDALLSKYNGVIVGRSAGATVMGEHCFVTNRYSGTARVVDGLGLVNFSVKVHYKQHRDAWIKSLSRMERIYGIPHQTALVCDMDRGITRFIGDVAIFEDEKCHSNRESRI
jgi:cyanophycinase-like exopeptidase